MEDFLAYLFKMGQALHAQSAGRHSAKPGLQRGFAAGLGLAGLGLI